MVEKQAANSRFGEKPKDKQSGSVSAPGSLAESGEKRTVLVVDDQSINRKILCRILRENYQLLEAENGAVALQILRARPDSVDAVLLDIVMPVLDGYAVLNAMQKDAALCRIPVIVSSQENSSDAEVKALSLGAQDFIAKPYKGDIIRHRLENTIRLRETASMVNRAQKDELTGIFNKTHFLEKAAEILRANPDTQYNILCADIARFKLVNDTYGAETGDELLRTMAGLMEAVPQALLTARFSADHFYQLIERPQTDEGCAEIFRGYLAGLREFPIEMELDVSCGVYQIGSGANVPVIAMCDRAKLAADQNRTRAEQLFSYYDDSMRKKLVEEQFILGAMKQGLKEHQFQVYYQPKYDLHTEAVAGAEALVRWVHPEKGFLSPGAFIPIFEKNGFIAQLDHYVWEQACADIRGWMDSGLPPVPVSVNVSRADIFNPALPQVLLELVQKYEIPLPYLHLEVTESAYTDDPGQIIAAVKKLHALGFVIEMDDFGSGYSSLNMLAELPVDVLKLDMGFVQSETNNASGRGIISFVISLAKWMKLSVVAEGVETADQIEALRSMDCNFVQGFYYAKPMPKAEFEKMLTTVAVSDLAQTGLSPASPQKAAQEAGQDHVMLIVDDIELNRAILAEMFRAEYNIVELGNGRDALEYLHRHGESVEVVMLDLLMPEVDGFQVLKKMRADKALARVPVIVTSQGDVTAEERALELGADDFISKPYSPCIVERRVRNVTAAYREIEHRREQLDLTRDREKTLMESIPGGVAIYHLDENKTLRTEYASEGLIRLCGYRADEFETLCRENGGVRFAAADLPRLTAAVRNALETGALIHEMQHIITRDGTPVTVRFDASVMPAAEGEAEKSVTLYAVHTKVSDDTETVLQEQYRYRYILDNLGVAYFEQDSNGRCYVSDQYSLYEMSAVAPAELLENAANFCKVHPEDAPLLFELLAKKKQNPPKISATVRLKMKDGAYRWTELMCFYEYDASGARTRTVVVLRDVDSEWQNQNRKLQAALDAAEKANASKTELLARVSHEMRTPLNGILGLTELMQGRTGDATLLDDVEQLRQSGHYLLELINDMLDVSTIEQGKMQLHPTVCDGKTAFNTVIDMVRPRMEEKHITFTAHAEALPFTLLYVDVGRVEQAVINVFANAVKFTPEGGRIDFEMKNLSHADGIITDQIVIRDTGIGMSSEFVKHLFEPFSQEHSDSRSAYRGAGLGMTIARRCVELMGGSIRVESEPGKGTAVTMVLPMQEATEKQKKEWTADHSNQDLHVLWGKRVLLCEDHPLNAQIVIRLLEKVGMKVDHAENGSIGVRRFAKSAPETYDAVLMDVRMPVMDGLEATRKIRALSRGDARRVPIVALTANTMAVDVKNALDAGMTEHLGKPVEPNVLYHTLVGLIERPNPFAGRKILVVDDLEINRLMVKKAIEDTYVVLQACNGQEALELLSREEDVVGLVTDIQMPGMDGKELIRRVRSDPRFENLPILANTIYGDHRQEEELLHIGANDFVYKPSSPQVIMMRLAHVMRTME